MTETAVPQDAAPTPGEVTFYVCGYYEGGMRDFHLSLLREAVQNGENPVSFIRLTRAHPLKVVRAEHARHGVDDVRIMRTTSWFWRQVPKLLPIFSSRSFALRRKLGAQKMVITEQGLCYGLTSAANAGLAEIFYHDPEPHLSADTSLKRGWEQRTIRYTLEGKPWKALLIGSAEFRPVLEARAVAPVKLIHFPHFTRHLFPPGHLPPELKVRDYLFLYGRMDRYKGIYEWLTAQAAAPGGFDALPPIVLAGRVLDKRLLEFEDRVTIINRFISYEEVGPLFSHAAATVLPYQEVTHSGVGDISISFGKPTYLPDLPYFNERYADEPLARKLANLRTEQERAHAG